VIARRGFITLLGSAAATWSLAARAQQVPPVVAVVSDAAPSENQSRGLAAVRRGLEEAGFTDGRNVTVEFYLADAQRMPSNLAVLASRKVSVIVATGNTVALLAKAATGSIPIVFGIGGNPVDLGLVASLARPGGNLTGFTNLNNELEAKRFEILAELVPDAATIAVLLNSGSQASVSKLAELEPAARRLGRQLRALKAGNEAELEKAFVIAADEHIRGLQISTDNFFNSQIERLAVLASRHAVPTISGLRDFAVNGGLASYGSNNSQLFHQLGIYAGRILKGEKPADLPVVQSSQFEFVLNLKVAKALGLTVPLPLLGRADEVIE
jgi:putative ABC transport system substrate-binding protein